MNSEVAIYLESWRIVSIAEVKKLIGDRDKIKEVI